MGNVVFAESWCLPLCLLDSLHWAVQLILTLGGVSREDAACLQGKSIRVVPAPPGGRGQGPGTRIW